MEAAQRSRQRFACLAVYERLSDDFHLIPCRERQLKGVVKRLLIMCDSFNLNKIDFLMIYKASGRMSGKRAMDSHLSKMSEKFH